MKLFRVIPVVASVGFAMPCFAEVPSKDQGASQHNTGNQAQMKGFVKEVVEKDWKNRRKNVHFATT